MRGKGRGDGREGERRWEGRGGEGHTLATTASQTPGLPSGALLVSYFISITVSSISWMLQIS